MRMRGFVYLLALFTFMTGTSLGDDWKMIYSKEGVSGYEKSVPGTEMKEFKAYGFVEARMEVIGEVLRDIPAYPKWMAKCRETKVLKDIDRNTKIFFNETATPWPVPNRGVIISNTSKYDLDTGRAVIKFKALDTPEYPVREGLVQIKELDGEYLLEFFGREMTKVTYRHRANPGGNVPIQIANYQSRLFPVINIQGLRKMVKLKKYQDLGTKCEEYRLIENMVKDPAAVKTISKNRLGEYFRNDDDIERIFRDNTVVNKIIKNRAGFDSIKHMVIDACKILINDPEVRQKYRNKSLRDSVNVEKFYSDRGLTTMFVQDDDFISLILNDKDLLRKILTDRILFAKIIDSTSLAKSIANDPVLISRLVEDDAFIMKIKSSSRLYQSPDDLRAMIEKRIGEYKNPRT
jgi:hypothetical protein